MHVHGAYALGEKGEGVGEVNGTASFELSLVPCAAGGADARPFVTYHNSLSRNFTLRIAT